MGGSPRMTEPTVPSRRTPVWQYPPLLAAGLALALVAIGEAYPFSHFPMYSAIESSADMLLVTNEKDEVLPLSRLFHSGSAQLKKRFEKELQTRAGTREYEKADPAKLQAAGEAFLSKLWEGRDAGDVAKLATPPQLLRLKIRTMTMEGTRFVDETHVISEISVTPKAGGTP